MVKLHSMRLYELALIINPNVSEPDRKKMLETVKSWLKGTKVTGEQTLGSRALKYKINKELTGYYYIMQLETENVLSPDVEKKLLANDKVLRHLMIRKK